MAYRCKTLIATEGDSSKQEKRLSICLVADGFSFSEISPEGELLTFGEAEGQHAATITDATRDIKAIFAEVGIRPLSYKGIELIVVSDDSAWVPDELYSTVASRSYLRMLGSTATSVVSAPCKQLGSTMVFAANDQLIMAFKVTLPGVTVMNQHVKIASLIPRSAKHPVMVAYWRCCGVGSADNGRVDIATMDGGKYIFGNTLKFDNQDEAVFHIVETIKAFGMDKPNAELLLCGNVDRDLYARLRPYFPTTTLYSGTASFTNPEFKKLHTYRHALILM